MFPVLREYKKQFIVLGIIIIIIIIIILIMIINVL